VAEAPLENVTSIVVQIDAASRDLSNGTQFIILAKITSDVKIPAVARF